MRAIAIYGAAGMTVTPAAPPQEQPGAAVRSGFTESLLAVLPAREAGGDVSGSAMPVGRPRADRPGAQQDSQDGGAARGAAVNVVRPEVAAHGTGASGRSVPARGKADTKPAAASRSSDEEGQPPPLQMVVPDDGRDAGSSSLLATVLPGMSALPASCVAAEAVSPLKLKASLPGAPSKADQPGLSSGGARVAADEISAEEAVAVAGGVVQPAAAVVQPGLSPVVQVDLGLSATVAENSTAMTPHAGQAIVPGSRGAAAVETEKTPQSTLSAEGWIVAEPRISAAHPGVLEVGFASGSQGWLRVRAELGQDGQVSAAVMTTSRSHAQALTEQLPALNSYLAAEPVAVHGVRIVVAQHVQAQTPAVAHAAAGAESAMAGGGEPGSGQHGAAQRASVAPDRTDDDAAAVEAELPSLAVLTGTAALMAGLMSGGGGLSVRV